MKITFFTNYVHHHQLPLADELYKLIGDEYKYVALEELPDWLIRGGYDPTLDRPYIIRAYKSEIARNEAISLIETSDVVITGQVPEDWFFKRKISNKLTFNSNERILKSAFREIIYPLGFPLAWKWFTRFRNKNSYMLCMSAFMANDMKKYYAYPNKCYKWGYFTKVDNVEGNTAVEASLDVSTSEITPLMWCSRFLKWKHPEMPILMAKRLKEKGYKFHLDMYGSGELLCRSTALVNKLNLNDVVKFCGNVPNEDILQAMREHEIFLFTSDRNEGWGAVANESMSNGCVLVGSDAIGATPFLIDNGKNGLFFKSSNSYKGFTKFGLIVDKKALNSLTEKVEWLLNHPKERKEMSIVARKTMMDFWSPSVAAKNLLTLIDSIQAGVDCNIEKGPCSKAYPI